MTNNLRIYELAKEYKISSNAMLSILNELKFKPKSHMSVVTDEMVEAIKKRFAEEKQEAKKGMEQQKLIKEAAEKKMMAGSIQISDKKAKKPAKKVEAKAVVEPAPAKPKEEKPKPVVTKTPLEKAVKKVEKKQPEKKTKKKDRRPKRGRQQVDQTEVAKSFKSTMANLGGAKGKKKYKRGPQSGTDEFEEAANQIEVTEFISVAELAKIINCKPADIIGKLFQMGMVATINQRLDMDTIEMVAGEYELEVVRKAEVGEEILELEEETNLEKRPPVVTVMGHVDHGKTSLLDYIRQTNVVSGEAGAITQHIGAYQVTHDGDKITFLDTPGHEAFTAMRARGAQITDVVVLVVAADDGVRPQTIEAIDHARAGNVPIIVAINKIDKPDANPDNVRNELSKLNLIPEDWGGKTIMVEISAKKGTGIEKLLELILLQAEMMDLKADPDIRAQGVIVDAHLEKGRGTVVTVLVQKGSCKVGDPIVAGISSGRTRTIVDDKDQKLKVIGPSMPAQITGLNGVPQAGDSFMACRSDQEAKEISVKRSQIKREHDARRMKGVTLDQIFDQIKEGQIKELRLIIKGDVDGSVEVLSDTLGKIATDEVKTNIIHRSVGSISESDVLLASASSAIIIGFSVSVDTRARELAKQEKVDIRIYDIIYEAEDNVKKALEGMLSPELSEEFVGTAEVRETFKVPKIGLIAGCYIRQGKIRRQDNVKLVRDGKVIFTGSLSSLKRFKDDAREVKEGFECGIGLENYNDVKVGDIIEAFEVVKTARTLS